jgi:hypothetical protein
MLAPTGALLEFRTPLFASTERLALRLAHSRVQLWVNLRHDGRIDISIPCPGRGLNEFVHIIWSPSGAPPSRTLLILGEGALLADGHQEELFRERPLHHDSCHQKLWERWRSLADPEDQQRIAHFWIGHPHPVLSQLGLEGLQTLTRHGPRV